MTDNAQPVTYKTREEWLHAATKLLQKGAFTRANLTIPEVQIACGWPSSRGLGTKKRALGECWDKKCSADKKPQIFLSPWLDNELHCQKPPSPTTGDFMGVLPTLAHELVHAVVGNDAKHGKVFGKAARGIGLEGKLTSTHAGAQLAIECEEIMKLLGHYPNAAINPLERNVGKKQTTRMVKCVCEREDCGFTVRTTRKWLDDVGAPHCPKHGAMSFDAESAEPEDEPDEE